VNPGIPVRRQQAMGMIAGAFLLAASAYLVSSAVTAGPGFPLDDAWIHQTYARNLGLHAEWTYGLDQPSAGSTSPLWSSILALAYFLGVDPLVWTMLLGLLGLSGLGLVCMRWFRARNPAQGHLDLWVLAAVLTEWHLLWAAFSGMEIVLFSLLVCLVLRRLDDAQSRPLIWGLIIGIGVWVRPEALTLIVPASWVILTREGNQNWRLTSLVLLGVGLVIGLVPYLIFNQVLDGTWWPSTYYAKQAEYATSLDTPLILRFINQAIQPITGVGLLLLPGLVWIAASSIQHRDWGKLAPLIWICVHLGAYAIRLPVTYQHGRYSMPVIAVLLMLGIEGTIGILHWLGTSRGRLVVARAWIISLPIAAAAFIFLGARAYGMDVAVIESEMVRSARWISANTPQASLIAAHDIGALGYYGDRDLLDLAGLVSPEVIPIMRDETALASLMNGYGVDYLMTFPGWYPSLTTGKMLVFQTEGKYSPSIGGENMSVYRWR